MARKRYSDAQRAAALARLDANGGNVKRTSKELGIPANTLKGWKLGNHAVGAELRAEKSDDLITQLLAVANKGSKLLVTKIDDAKPGELATVVGICIDKARLLQEKATSINARARPYDDLSDAEITDKLRTIAARFPLAVGANGNPPGKAKP